jgi:WD repeat and SOF domain-containing protein 1
MHVTLASEDHDLYTFDMRKLNHAICVHSGHVSAVLDVDYSPTGTQFVSAAYDKTIRM